MTIQIGDRIPEVVLKYIDDGVQAIDTPTLFEGSRVVLFAVPGAFTPTCSERHLPGFIEQFPRFQERGIHVACMAVNDPFVMRAWGEKGGVGDKVKMLPDGNATFTTALGLTMDGSGYGLGTRGQRFALVAEDGKVTHVAVEAPGKFEVSSAEAVLEKV